MEQMTQAERERAEKAAKESYHKDLAIKSWQEGYIAGCLSGYLAGYEQAMKDAEKLKD